jgi:hypothetical protein
MSSPDRYLHHLHESLPQAKRDWGPSLYPTGHCDSRHLTSNPDHTKRARRIPSTSSPVEVESSSPSSTHAIRTGHPSDSYHTPMFMSSLYRELRSPGAGTAWRALLAIRAAPVPDAIQPHYRSVSDIGDRSLNRRCHGSLSDIGDRSNNRRCHGSVSNIGDRSLNRRCHGEVIHHPPP